MNQQTVIITGGSSGIGRATALAFAEKNAQVLITGRRASRLKEVADLHPNINYLQADSADPQSAEFIIEKAISLWGKLDVLVNNVGAGLSSHIEDITEEGVANVFAVNIVGTSVLTKLSIPHLRKTRGTVINVSSAVANKILPGISHYGASKAALNYLTKAWALELAPDIRVNAIAPGSTESGALTGMMGLTEEQARTAKEQETKMTPMGRRGVPEDISAWIVWLTDPSTAWTTGQIISVDGGFELA
jgi:NAD(P)-dependent dehydrogenase (short-subunit alcohol dehydrogenase family)